MKAAFALTLLLSCLPGFAAAQTADRTPGPEGPGLRTPGVPVRSPGASAPGSPDLKVRGYVPQGFQYVAPGLQPRGPSQPAHESPVVRLTPDSAVEMALAASHRVAEWAARIDAARAVVDSRSAADNPTLTLLAGYTRTNHVDEYGIQIPGMPLRVIYPDVPDNWRARADVQWPVYTAGRVAALERAAAADLDATDRDAGAVRADTRLDATRAFWMLYTARESARVVAESLARVEAHLKDVEAMNAAGLVAPNDVLTVEARRSRERVLLIEAQNARDVAEADLRRATGLAPGTRIELDLTPGPAPGDPADVAALVEVARQNRPERQALELRVQAVDERRTIAASARKPTVALVAGADYARPNQRIFPRAAEWNPSFDVGVNVAWTAWDGGRAKADLAEADATRRAAALRLAELDRMIEFEVTQRTLDLASAQASVGAARDGERASAEAHRVVSNRFKAGLVGNSDVLDAQMALLMAQLDVTRAQTAVRLAQARLDRTLGR
ncbi:MAG: TolC family protein [Vicinamibacterales bacterium]|nr:TolC family protein [Vicinamibacterales bacterium]